MPSFKVDTHLFRELGDLLVGRDSTALMELLKNSYDADAQNIWVFGEHLADPERGRLVVTDDGTGMTSSEFRQGFLTIATRRKEAADRRSLKYERRFTGAKGIGRLAAHKLARHLHIESLPGGNAERGKLPGISATIDWDEIERHRTLDDVGEGLATRAIRSASIKSGTIITLSNLRRGWTSDERGRFLAEVQSFEPPPLLVGRLPRSIVPAPLVFPAPHIRDTGSKDKGYSIHLEGDLEAGEEFWRPLGEGAHWVIEISARRDSVRYGVSPTANTLRLQPDARTHKHKMDHPASHRGPFFDARIFVRVGTAESQLRTWAARTAGVRVYMEGFRVLPYGEQRNDWLGLDADVARRTRSRQLDIHWLEEERNPQEGLSILPNQHYYGAVFVTEESAPGLRMLVNREGFVPDESYVTLQELVRTGISLSTRIRAMYAAERQEVARKTRLTQGLKGSHDSSLRTQFIGLVQTASQVLGQATVEVANGDYRSGKKSLALAEKQIKNVALLSEDVFDEEAMVRVLASVGAQMAAFVHEINGLLGATRHVEGALHNARSEAEGPLSRSLAKVDRDVRELRQSLERQASYLTDIVTPDARRRRRRQPIADVFDRASHVVFGAAAARGIDIINSIPPDLKSPPMFRAELIALFSNLLTNAVKAAGRQGRIRARATHDGRSLKVTIENTGRKVNLTKSEELFRPFKSTTVKADPVLGQGMGLGLSISRRMLEEYGGEIHFVAPRSGFSSAVQITMRAR